MMRWYQMHAVVTVVKSIQAADSNLTQRSPTRVSATQARIADAVWAAAKYHRRDGDQQLRQRRRAGYTDRRSCSVLTWCVRGPVKGERWPGYTAAGLSRMCGASRAANTSP